MKDKATSENLPLGTLASAAGSASQAATPPTPPPPTSPVAAPRTRKKSVKQTAAGPGAQLVEQQIERLKEAKKIKSALNDIAGLSEWGVAIVTEAVVLRREQLKKELNAAS